MKIFSNNKKAFFEYTISDKIEVGIVLTGSEVKSIRAGQSRLNGAYAIIMSGELILINCNIAHYKFAYFQNKQNELRNRILLVHKKELQKLTVEVAKKGITLIPLKIYENDRGYIKLEIGVGKHKKLYDRREEIKERDIKRETMRELRGKKS